MVESLEKNALVRKVKVVSLFSLWDGGESKP